MENSTTSIRKQSHVTCNTISLIKKSAVITSEKALAKTINESFVGIIPNLGIDAHNVSEVTKSDKNSLTSIIERYKHMDKIEKPNLSFKEITKPFVVKEIKNLKPKKTSQSNDIPAKLIKEFSDIFATIIVEDFNKHVIMVPFQKVLKYLR